ncbi:MAG TPA: BTAD domain-containing putative transcriptional regulator [Gemmatirosa sp.]|nr:BTAD domain-containing putative transcriptional regulator [Gemmatirosa sp.]
MRDHRFRLVTLGRLALRSPDGDDEPSLSRRRLKLAVLAVLAIERRPVARDALVEMFWGEQEEARARHSLSDALSHLRRVLGTGAITTRGAEVALADAAPIIVDALEFAEAARREDAAAAIALYGGPFLHCVYVAASPSFERWAERERGRLEATFLRSCAGHCVVLARARRWDEVSMVAERWLDAAPASSDAALFRLNALKAPGTRDAALAALAEYERLRVRLARELDVAPDPVVAELAARIAGQAGVRDASDASDASAASDATRVPAAPAEAHGVKAHGVKAHGAEPPAAAPPATPTVVAAPHAPPRSLAARPLGLATLALLGAVVAALAVWRSAEPALSRTTVAVLPFAVRGERDHAYLQEGMVDLLSTSLDGAGALRAVDPRAVLGRVARARDGGAVAAPEVVAPDRARRVARDFGAGLFVLGEVIGVAGRVRISASLYDARRDGRETARGAVEGAPAELFALVDRLTRQLLAGYPDESPDRLTGLAARTTASLPALKAYLAGVSAYRTARFDVAVAAFREAAREDSTFALAHYQLGNAMLWDARGGWDSVASTARRAVRHASRLTPRARLLVEAHAAFRTGELGRAERLYRTVVGAYPDDVEAWYQLGDVLYHGNAHRGRSFVEARPAFARVLALEPEHLGALLHLLRIELWAGRSGAADTLIARAAAIGGPLVRPELAALRAFARGDTAAQRAAVAALADAPDEVVRVAAMRVALFTGDLDGAARIARLLVALARAPEFRAVGRLQLADLALARGRRRAARAALDSAALGASGVIRGVALEYRALHLAQPFLAVPRAELAAMRDTLARWEALVPSTPFPMWAVYDGLHPHIRRYLVGVLSVRLGDDEEAVRQARALDEAAEAAAGEPRAFAAGLAAAVRAHLHARRGRPDLVVATLEQVRPGVSEGLLDAPFANHATERWARAEALRAMGRDDAARAWYASLGETTIDMTIYAAPAQLRLGELAERRGDARRAAAHYARFVALWRDADPELRPTVDWARRRLAALAAHTAAQDAPAGGGRAVLAGSPRPR